MTSDKGQTYLLNNVPRDLWTALKAKCEAEEPPVSIRWVIIQLLTKWVTPEAVKAAKTTTIKPAKPIKPPKATKARTEAVVTPVPAAPPTTAPTVDDSDPDLSQVF